MSKVKISFLETEKWEQGYLQDRLKNVKGLSLQFSSKPISKTILPRIKDSDVLAVFIYSHLDKQVIEQMPQLKFVTTMSTGFDHIDLEACKSRKILVSNVPFYGENTVAEHTFALILALSRYITQSIDKIRRHDFDLSDIRGFDLKGKTLGIVGMGHIGQHVARMANGFEMKVLAFDPNKDAGLAKKFGFKYATLNKLLSASDIITLHAPYNKHTHHMINKDNIKMIKKGAYLINTARGGLVETQVLVEALNKGIIAGAGLDVLEEESFIKEEKELLSKPFQQSSNLQTILQGHMLIHHPRVLVTPHNAFNSQEALQRILDTTVENIKAFLNKKHINKVK